MSQDESSGPDLELSGPDLNGVVADANAVDLQFVVIGGFSVIANGFMRATDDRRSCSGRCLRRQPLGWQRACWGFAGLRLKPARQALGRVGLDQRTHVAKRHQQADRAADL